MAAAKAPKQRAPYRRWPLAEKRRIVELTLAIGASARAIAREHGLHPNSLCQWRALYRAGKRSICRSQYVASEAEHDRLGHSVVADPPPAALIVRSPGGRDTVGGVAGERQVVGDRWRRTPNFATTPASSNVTRAPVELHDARAAEALCERCRPAQRPHRRPIVHGKRRARL